LWQNCNSYAGHYHRPAPAICKSYFRTAVDSPYNQYLYKYVKLLTMREYFLKQFAFEQWSNGTILSALQQLSQPNERAVLLFSHLLSSHSMWLSRVTHTPFTCTLFQERTLAECEQLIAENYNGWQQWLQQASNEDLAANMPFMPAWEQNPVQRMVTVQDAITHLINHSSYHRGQIVAGIKGMVPQLPLSTYIMYASKVM
jgi:uncharacterized damage-inducible protein DinB